MSSMSGKAVLITGGTSGIGLATARLFLEQGAGVAIVGRDREKGEKAVKELSSYGKACYIEADVAKVTDCQKAVAQTCKTMGRLDIVVNCAGAYQEKAIEEVTEADYAAIMDVNVKGTYFIAKFAVPELKKGKGGAIVNVSSDAGLQGNWLCTAYCAAKGAVNTFTKALALELAPYGIRVNAVCPGDIHTPLLDKQLAQVADRERTLRDMAGIYPLGRLGTPAEVAQVILFLASPQAAFVTGALWSVDGGLTAC